MASDIFGALFGKADSMGNTMVQALYTNLAQELQPVFTIAMAIYFVWWGYELAFGRAEMTAGNAVWRIGRMLIIYTFAFSWGTFSPTVADVATKVPTSVAATICEAAGGDNCSADSSSTSQGLTNIWNTATAASTKVSAAGGWTGVGLMMIAIVILIVVGIMLALALALIMLGKMALFILLATAPIFIAMALFNFTSPLFTGWMTSLFQYSLIPIVVYAILGVMLLLVKDSMTQLANASSSDVAMTVVGPFLLMCATTCYLLGQSISLAHGLAGGARLQGGEAASRIAYRALGGGARMAAVTGFNGAQRLASARFGSTQAQIEAAVRSARS